MTKYKFGALKDTEDKRDYFIKDILKPIALPTYLDLSSTLQPVRNQGSLGSCVAFAATSAKEAQEPNEGWLSTLYMYERIKQPGGGAYPRHACDLLLYTGVPPESCQPYSDTTITPECSNAIELAKQNKIQAYYRLLTIEDMKQCLYQYGCFMISFSVYEGWIYPDINGIVHPTGNLLGGHALCCCGYDETKKLLKFKNSWGADWNKSGFGYISYSDTMLTLYDAWKTIDIPEPEEEKPLPPPEPKKKSWWQRFLDWIKGLYS